MSLVEHLLQKRIPSICSTGNTLPMSEDGVIKNPKLFHEKLTGTLRVDQNRNYGYF